MRGKYKFPETSLFLVGLHFREKTISNGKHIKIRKKYNEYVETQ